MTSLDSEDPEGVPSVPTREAILDSVDAGPEQAAEGTGQAVQPAPTEEDQVSSLDSEEPEGVPSVATREAMLDNINTGPELAPDQTDVTANTLQSDTETGIAADSVPEPVDPCTESAPGVESTLAATATITIEVTRPGRGDPEGIPDVKTREAMLDGVNLGPTLSDDTSASSKAENPNSDSLPTGQAEAPCPTD